MHRVFFFAILLTSCGVHVTNWQGTSIPGFDTARYEYFNEKISHKVQIEKGDLLFLDFTAESEKGSVDISVHDKRRRIWQQKNAGDSCHLYLVAAVAGTYIININGHEARGGYTLRYSVSKPKSVSVKNSVNIELFGLLMQLDNAADFIAARDTVPIDGRNATWAEWYALAVQNYHLYKSYDTCRAMRLYRNLVKQGVYNDFFIDFLLQVDEAPHSKINASTDPTTIQGFSPKGDIATATLVADEFLAALNDLYYEPQFDKYLEMHKEDYSQANEQVRMNLPGSELLPVMEHYYRKRFEAYYLVPSLNILTSMGFGKVNRISRTIYNVFGPFSFQTFDPQHRDMGFNYPERIKALSVHEFGHSFVNPSVDRLPATLVAETAYLFDPIKQQMEKHAYPSWQICLYEHFVKAGEYIIASKLGDTSRARALLTEAVQAGFVYLPFLVNELQRWDEQVSPASYDEAVLQALQALEKKYPKR